MTSDYGRGHKDGMRHGYLSARGEFFRYGVVVGCVVGGVIGWVMAWLSGSVS